MIELIGIMAGILSMSSLVPQLYKTYKTKLTRDLSIKWMLISLSAHALWLTYGMANSITPIIMTSVYMITMTAILIFMKNKYD